MDLDVTGRAIGVLRVEIVLRACRLNRPHAMIDAVTGQTELRHPARDQQSRISRTMRCMTGNASFGLDRRVFIGERALLVGVTLDASGIGARGQPRLFEFKAAVRVMTIGTLHRAFENFVMERLLELMLHLGMATETELRLA